MSIDSSIEQQVKDTRTIAVERLIECAIDGGKEVHIAEITMEVMKTFDRSKSIQGMLEEIKSKHSSDTIAAISLSLLATALAYSIYNLTSEETRPDLLDALLADIREDVLRQDKP